MLRVRRECQPVEDGERRRRFEAAVHVVVAVQDAPEHGLVQGPGPGPRPGRPVLACQGTGPEDSSTRRARRSRGSGASGRSCAMSLRRTSVKTVCAVSRSSNQSTQREWTIASQAAGASSRLW
ncbi:hypothetical protein [Streptomyces sp. DSM 41634]|uniref:hypothetical protein n=1 Tax=Streptomyces sp. DSM 41634 TaxID=3448656 RepID=UPI002887B0D3|nr:hypothetical protein [Streptomyces sp. DSM 41633]